jgi:predicted GNAT superfamily acetyltransferase
MGMYSVSRIFLPANPDCLESDLRNSFSPYTNSTIDYFTQGMMSMSHEIIIRSVASLAEMERVQQLEQEVWKMEHPVPLHQLLTSVKNGGLLLGAYEDELLIGLLYAFPGFARGEAYLCSHMMGIREGWRSRGIGERLKQRQAEMAREQGYRLVTWTYDPLETANGYLNIGKLGAVCGTYIINCYGEMNDLLNQGLPSDRFQVEWWVDQELPPLSTGEEAKLLGYHRNERGLPVPELIYEENAGYGRLVVTVPSSIQDIKKADIGLAKHWREVTREAFCQAFGAGWIVGGFRPNSGSAVHDYILVERRHLGLPLPPWGRMQDENRSGNADGDENEIKGSVHD